MKEWHARRRLPHWEAGAVPQSITFRLADSLPRAVLEARLPHETRGRRSLRLDSSLDLGHGEGCLARPDIGSIIEGALRYFDTARYVLNAWCVMPNHVHVLVTPFEGYSLSSVVHSWKSYSARAINATLERSGPLWASEYFDRAIRDDDHFGTAVAYIEGNPVKAGLCMAPGDWPYSSARLRDTEGGLPARPA